MLRKQHFLIGSVANFSREFVMVKNLTLLLLFLFSSAASASNRRDPRCWSDQDMGERCVKVKVRTGGHRGEGGVPYEWGPVSTCQRERWCTGEWPFHEEKVICGSERFIVCGSMYPDRDLGPSATHPLTDQPMPQKFVQEDWARERMDNPRPCLQFNDVKGDVGCCAAAVV